MKTVEQIISELQAEEDKIQKQIDELKRRKELAKNPYFMKGYAIGYEDACAAFAASKAYAEMRKNEKPKAKPNAKPKKQINNASPVLNF